MKRLLSYVIVMESHKPYIAMLFIQFVYAGMALFSKAAIAKGMNPYVFVVYRQAFASIALAPFAFFLERKEAAPLSYYLLCKIFLVSLCGLTLSLNLYYVAINYTSATFAAASTNTIPAITFVMAFCLRMESISMKHLHGLAKVLGSVLGLSGALVFAFVKGPPLKFMNWYPEIQNEITDPSINCSKKVEWVKGALIMLSANTAWSLWLILQGPIIKQYPAKLRLTTLQCFFSCIQSVFCAVAMERNLSSWKLEWDVHLLSVAYCVFVTGITYWLQVWAIEKKGPVFTAMFTPLALIITAIFSAFLWKETLYWGRSISCNACLSATQSRSSGFLLSYVTVMESHKPYIVMIFIQFVYTGMAMLSKAAIAKGMNPFVFVVYRQAFASVALAPFAFFLESKETAPLSFNLLCKFFLCSLCGPTLSLNLYYVAINYTTATFVTAATNTIPAITFIMAVLFRMESISVKHLRGLAKVLGSVVGVSGALVYAFVKGPPVKFMNWFPEIQKDATDPSRNKEDWVKGALLMLAANTAWSSWLIFQGPIMKQYPAKLRLTTLQCFFCCIQSMFWAVGKERKPSAWKLGWDLNLLSVAYCGVVVTGITYWLQVWVIEKRGPVFTAMFSPLCLVITAIFSTFMWKETLYWGSVGGAILLTVGLYGVLWGKKKERKHETTEQRQESKEETALECISTHR
ncbi:hypothetical protein L1049_025747 [Liquidambar formosana]|uniref:EamA domain-containing protein n=1 Tax=Liquidambar formosana TaxID=63359 RepID=A0AAP0NDP1_LIQFO